MTLHSCKFLFKCVVAALMSFSITSNILVMAGLTLSQDVGYIFLFIFTADNFYLFSNFIDTER